MIQCANCASHATFGASFDSIQTILLSTRMTILAIEALWFGGKDSLGASIIARMATFNRLCRPVSTYSTYFAKSYLKQARHHRCVMRSSLSANGKLTVRRRALDCQASGALNPDGQPSNGAKSSSLAQ